MPLPPLLQPPLHHLRLPITIHKNKSQLRLNLSMDCLWCAYMWFASRRRFRCAWAHAYHQWHVLERVNLSGLPLADTNWQPKISQDNEHVSETTLLETYLDEYLDTQLRGTFVKTGSALFFSYTFVFSPFVAHTCLLLDFPALPLLHIYSRNIQATVSNSKM